MRINLFFKKIVLPKSENEDLKRREFILNILLLSSLFFLIVANIIIIIDFIQLGSSYRGASLFIPLFILFFFIFLFYLSRMGFFALSAYLLLGVYFTLSSYLLYTFGIELPSGLLFYILIIIMSGILLSTRFAFISTIISSFFLITVNYYQTNNIIQSNLYWMGERWDIGDVILTSIIFFIIATVSWLSNREIEKSLKRARTSEVALKKERDMLEVKVEERTKELKQVQLEKMTQLYRFAEFGRLSGGLFHDLINPLTIISLNIEQIKNSPDSKINDVRSYLNQAIEASNRMEDFIIAVRKQMAKEENGKLFSLTEEVRQAIQVLSYKARKANVNIEFFPSENVDTFGEGIKFNQVITNLVANAIDSYIYREEVSGKKNIQLITISLKEENGLITLVVEDCGAGIKEADLNKIFEPFFSTKTSKTNTGIGLSLVKNIIEKEFHGTIRAESKDITKFTVKFYKNKKNSLITPGSFTQPQKEPDV